MNYKASLVSIAAVVCFPCLLLVSCGSSPSTTPPGIRVSLSLGTPGSSQTIKVGQSLSIFAAVANDSSGSGVKWSLSGGGSLASETPNSVVYYAPEPDTLFAKITATVTATSVADSAAKASMSITVNPGPPPPLSISINCQASPCQTVVDSPMPLTAAVKNDPNNAGVEWSLTGAGSLTNQTPTAVTYDTPPNPPGTNPTLTATSITDPSVSASIYIYVLQLLEYCNQSQCWLPTATLFEPYTYSMGTVGVPPDQWSGGGGGLIMSPSGVLSGIVYPPPPGETVLPYMVDVAVSDSTKPIPNTGSATFYLPYVWPTTLAIVTVPPLPQSSVGASYKQTIQAMNGTAPYAWSISSGSLPPGLSINATSGAITGSPTTAGTFNFTVEVTDSATPVPATFSANFNITIQPQLTLGTTSMPAGSVGAAYAQTLQATGGIPPYTFALQSGSSLPAGLTFFSEIAGVPTTAGTTNFTVVATDSQGTTATGNLSITVAGANCPGNSSLQGNYAFLFSGYFSPQVYTEAVYGNYVGSFVADGAGNITQGYVDGGIFSPQQTQTLTGTYCISGNIGTLVLTGFPPEDNIFPSPLISTFQFVFQASGNGNATIYENPQSYPEGYLVPEASGVLLKQTPADFNLASISGNYIFSLIGGESAQAGAFTANGTSTLSNGEFDANDGGNLFSAPLTATDLAVASTGRGTVTLNAPVGGGGSTVQFSAVFYVVNSSELLAIGNGYWGIGAGQIVQQAAGSFSNNSLSGTSVLGLNTWHDNLAEAGLITWDGNGNFTWAADQNDYGIMSTPSYSGTYYVASNGRVTLSEAGLPGQPPPPILYLSGQNQGFLLGQDLGATSGPLFAQSGAPYSAASFSGTYAGGNLLLANLVLEADTLSADGVVNVTGTSDQSNYPLGNNNYGPASIPVSGTYSVSSNGRGVITQNGTTTDIFYIVSPTQILTLSSGNSTPELVSLSH